MDDLLQGQYELIEHALLELVMDLSSPEPVPEEAQARVKNILRYVRVGFGITEPGDAPIQS